MEELKTMMKSLIASVQGQMGNLENVDAKELGEAVDMIKDLAEAEYYCSVKKAMDESKEERENREKIDSAVAASMGTQNYYGGRYNEPHYYGQLYYDPRYENDRMYYDGRDRRRGYDGYNRGYEENGQNREVNGYINRSTMPTMARDYREGRSYMSRKGYMESKENHEDKSKQMQELERYITELGSDITDMIRDASPEEKQMLRDRLVTLSQKIS